MEECKQEDLDALWDAFMHQGSRESAHSVRTLFSKLCFELLRKGRFSRAFRLAAKAQLPYVLKILKECAREKGQLSLVAAVRFAETEQAAADAGAQDRAP